MKLKYSFECMGLDDHIVAVPVGEGSHEFHGVLELNESAAEIFDLLREEINEDAIVEEMQKKHGEDTEIPAFVHEMIEYLTGEGVLE